MFASLLKPFQRARAASRGEGRSAAALALVAQGNAAEDAGRPEEARALYERALGLAPRLPAAHLNLGIVREALGEADAARGSYLQVLALQPGHPFAAYNLGKLEYTQGRLHEAEPLLRAAIAGKADFHEAWVLLSNVLDARGDLQAAAQAISQALRLRPEYAGALFNQSCILRRLGRLADAEDAARGAVRLDPKNPDAFVALADALVLQGFAAAAVEPLRRAIALAPQRLELLSRELFLLNLVEGLAPREIWRRHLEAGRLIEASLAPRAHPAPDAAKPRLRLGFVGAELRTHPVALFLLPVIERLDRRRFEVVCYSSTAKSDQITGRLRGLSDHWVDAHAWSDAQLAEAIAADRVDLLVDLDGHTSHARLPVFAARPAPVQIAWVGYLNTTGLSRMDYRLTDARCDPPESSQPLHTERLLLLPDSQWCYRPFVDVPCAPAAPCERNGFVTFGSLNNVTKVTDEMVERWARILRAVPDARLLVADVDAPRRREALRARMATAGVEPDRLRFVPRADLPGYYRLMDEIDIALDSHPYGGGTTTFDALWMGVPVLTAPGATACSRSAASVLAVLGLHEWIAADVAGYESLAIARAGDPGHIAHLRRTLRERLRQSVLMDESRYVAAFAAALDRAWDERAAATRGAHT